MASKSPTDRARLIALLDGREIGAVYQDSKSRLSFRYLSEWRESEDSFPLSLSMPLTAEEHKHEAVQAYLWGLLPDNEKTLDQYGRTFGVSARSPVALLAHIGADCAGAVQLVPPERLEEFKGEPTKTQVEWISEAQVAKELRSAKEIGLAGRDKKTVGQFSLAGAQPKIALFHNGGRWGNPIGRTPTTHILKPPSPEFPGFAENEHLCLDVANRLGLSAAHSTVRVFEDEPAIIVERFDRVRADGVYRRIHQEDLCQAFAVLPWNKYENEGGPGISSIVSLIQESSVEPETDLPRFLDAITLNWVLAATDGHAKNYALLHAPGGVVRLAPFYDIASYLPYTDDRLFDVKMAMRVGKEYLVNRIVLKDWVRLANSSRIQVDYLIDRIEALLTTLPEAAMKSASRAISDGLSREFVTPLTDRIVQRTQYCLERIHAGKTAAKP